MHVKIKTCVFAAVIAISNCFACFSADVFKADSYVKIDVKLLKATPEEFKNKKISYESEYRGFKTNFPSFMERGGLKSTKCYWLEFAPEGIPVIAEKTDEFNKIILKLNKDSFIKLYGRIKELSVLRKKGEKEPDFKYYLELDSLEVVSEAAERKDNDPPPPPRNQDRKQETIK